MEKETLSKQLFGMLGETIISERTMGDYLDSSVMPHLPEDDTKMEEFLHSHIAILKSMDGQIRNNVANQIKDFKTKTQSVPEPSTLKKEPASDDKPAYVKDMEEALKNMTTTVQGLQESAKKKADAEAKTLLLNNAKAMIGNEGATDELVLECSLPFLHFEPDTPVEDVAKQLKTKYNELYTKMKGKGYEPMGTGSSNPIDGKESLLSFKEQMIKEGKLPSTTNQ